MSGTAPSSRSGLVLLCLIAACSGRAPAAAGHIKDAASPQAETRPASDLAPKPEPTWQVVTGPPILVGDFTTTLLKDGTVLITGGIKHYQGVAPHASVYRFYPETNTLKPDQPMAMARYAHTATRLTDGRVLVSGGDSRGSDDHPYAELFDPEKPLGKRWRRLPESEGEPCGAIAVLLPSGEVFRAHGGGNKHNPSLILRPHTRFDPVTETWTKLYTPPDGAYLVSAAGFLAPDGNVYVLGGFLHGDRVEKLDSVTGRLLKRWSLLLPRTGASTIVRLGPTRFMLIGGNGDYNEGPSNIDNAEVIDLATGEQRLLDHLGLGVHHGPPAVTLPSGKVLVFLRRGTFQKPIMMTGLIDPDKGFEALPYRYQPDHEGSLPWRATLLQDGSVLLLGQGQIMLRFYPYGL